MLFFNRHRRFRNNLSAYIDGELDAGEVRAIEAHLQSCERCREELAQLRATAGGLKTLPEAEPRRSFALTPEMVAEPRPAGRRGPPPALVHGTRLAAAGLAAALAIVFVIDINDSTTREADDQGLATERVEGEAYDASSPVPAFGEGGAAAPGEDAADGAGGGSPAPTGIPDSTGGEGDADSALDSGADEPPPPPEEDGGAREPATGEDAGDEVAQTETDDLASGGDRDAEDGIRTADNGDGFDTVLALEIGLGAALAVAVAGAALASVAARRRGT